MAMCRDSPDIFLLTRETKDYHMIAQTGPPSTPALERLSLVSCSGEQGGFVAAYEQQGSC